MNEHIFINAMCYIDDSFITESINYSEDVKNNIRYRQKTFKYCTKLVACMFLILLGIHLAATLPSDYIHNGGTNASQSTQGDQIDNNVSTPTTNTQIDIIPGNSQTIITGETAKNENYIETTNSGVLISADLMQKLSDTECHDVLFSIELIITIETNVNFCDISNIVADELSGLIEAGYDHNLKTGLNVTKHSDGKWVGKTTGMLSKSQIHNLTVENLKQYFSETIITGTIYKITYEIGWA